MSSKGPPQKFSEFKLKLSGSTVTDHQHHIMILNSTSLNLGDLTTPLRLHRQDQSAEMDEEAGQAEGNEERRTRKRKTRIVSLERKSVSDEEDRVDEEQEQVPWILEDADAQHTFMGRLEGGQQANYVFFVNQGRDFLVVPASRWYRFNPKPSYRPLTTEEAEAQMAARGRNRALLTQQYQDARQREAAERLRGGEKSHMDIIAIADDVNDLSQSGMNRLKVLRESLENEAQVAAAIGQYGRAAMARNRDGGDFAPPDALDFEEVFDDDEGTEDLGAGGDEDDPSAPRPVLRMSSRPKAKLSAAGREMGKLVRTFDRSTVDYRLSDEERDPYADPDEYESDNDEGALSDSSTRSSQGLGGSAGRMPPHLSPLPRPSSLPSLTGSGSSMTGTGIQQRPFSSSSSTSPEKRKAAAMYPTSGPSVLTANDIIASLRRGPQRTRDLIGMLRDKLQDPANKEAFKEIVRRVAIVKPGTTEDEKWLELRPEFH